MSVEDNQQIGNDLIRLATILQSYDICRDVNPLISAGNECVYSATDTTWKYTLPKLGFAIDEVNKRITSDSTDITVSLSITIMGDTSPSINLINPLADLLFDLEIDASELILKLGQ